MIGGERFYKLENSSKIHLAITQQKKDDCDEFKQTINKDEINE
jgi:hypothetical protein